MEIFLIILFSLLLLPGLAGAILPIPGLAYMFVVALVYGYITDFQRLSWPEMVVLGVILLISILTDTFSGVLGAKYGGASKQSIVAGLVGMIVGVVAFPPFGGFLGMFVAVLIWEISNSSSRRKALQAAGASVAGSALGMLLSLVLSIIFIITFILMTIF